MVKNPTKSDINKALANHVDSNWISILEIGKIKLCEITADKFCQHELCDMCSSAYLALAQNLLTKKVNGGKRHEKKSRRIK
jgi:hypothetical protein